MRVWGAPSLGADYVEYEIEDSWDVAMGEMTRAWVESALNDTEPPITGMDGLLVMEATIASYESSRLEKRIKLRDIQDPGISAPDTQRGVI